MRKTKRLKSVIAFAISLVLLLGAAIPALAAGSASITIRPNGQALTPADRFTAYQVFAGTVTADDELSNLNWGSGVSSEELVTAMKQSQLPVSGGTFGEKFTEAYNAWNQDYEKQLSEAAFVAQWLSANNLYANAFARIAAEHTNGAGESSKTIGGNWVIENLEEGYYLVVDGYKSADDHTEEQSDGSVSSYILQVLGNETIDLKASVPTVDKKVESDNGALTETGKDVTFTLTGTVAENIGEYEKYSYKFTDTLSAGLTMDAAALSSMTVTFYSTGNSSGLRLTKQSTDQGYTAALSEGPEGTAHTLTITFTDLKAAITAVDPDFDFSNADEVRSIKIVVSYKAKLNKYAVVGSDGNPNSVVLEYSNDPYSDGTGKTVPDEPKTYTLALKIVKQDEKGTPMEGVKFKLKNSSEQYATLDKVDGTDPNNPYMTSSETYYAITGWVASPGGTELVTDDQGKINIHGFDVGTYTLVETETKEGYDLMEPVTFTITGEEIDGNGGLGGDITVNDESLTHGRQDVEWNNGKFGNHTAQMTLKNFKSPLLPHTGGVGAMIVYIISGLAVLAGAAIVLAAARKRGCGRHEQSR